MPNRLGAMPAKVKAAPKLAEEFYTSVEWRRTIAQIKRDRGAYCERCGSGHRVIGDHKVERKDGGADFDWSNIELLCARHHAEKTAAARAERASGRSASTPAT